MFVSGRVAIGEYGVIAEHEITPDINVVFIHPKPPYGVRNAILSTAAKIDPSKLQSNVDIDLGEWNNALLLHMVTGWQGPDFAEFPYSELAKRNLVPLIDSDEPIWQHVINEIQARFKTSDSKSKEEGKRGPKLTLIESGD